MNKMKLLVGQALIVAFGLFLGGCTAELEEKIARLEADNAQLDSLKTHGDSEIMGYISEMNEIASAFTEIKEKENIISDLGKGKIEFSETLKDQVISDLASINALLQENKKKVSALRKRLKGSDRKVAELTKMIDMLSMQIASKDEEIVELQSELGSVNEQLKILFEEYNNRVIELDEKDVALNTAYYCYGTAKELEEKGVISKEGGVVGIGSTKQLKQNFNKDYFTEVDINDLTEIPLNAAKKADVLTNHPSDSYEIVGEKGNFEKILISDPQSFWSTSKYLVVIVK